MGVGEASLAEAPGQEGMGTAFSSARSSLIPHGSFKAVEFCFSGPSLKRGDGEGCSLNERLCRAWARSLQNRGSLAQPPLPLSLHFPGANPMSVQLRSGQGHPAAAGWDAPRAPCLCKEMGAEQEAAPRPPQHPLGHPAELTSVSLSTLPQQNHSGTRESQGLSAPSASGEAAGGESWERRWGGDARA